MATLIISANTTGTYTGDDTDVADTFMWGHTSYQSNNYGSNSQARVTRWDNTTNDRRIQLLHFGLTSLPAGCTINSAELRLYCISTSGADTADIRRLLVPWVESEATWLIRSTGNSWSTAGALGDGTDRNATIIGVLPNGTGWDSVTSSGLAAWVQGVVDGTWSNYGLVLQDTSTDWLKENNYHSSEGTDGLRPALIIDYTESSGYAGIGEIVLSGSSVSEFFNNYNYTPLGNLLLSGESISLEFDNYIYDSLGDLLLNGTSVTSYQSIGDFIYSGVGNVLLNGLSDFANEYNYLFSSSGETLLSGTSEYIEQYNYNYLSLGELLFSGESSNLEANYYIYDSLGNLLFTGSAVASYTQAGDFIYSGLGNLLLNGFIESSESHNYLFSANGNIDFSSFTEYEIGEKYYVAVSLGNLLFTGSAVTRQVGLDEHLYNGLGEILLEGTAIQPYKVRGLLNITFNSLIPYITFDSIKPEITFDSIKPEITFSGDNGE